MRDFQKSARAFTLIELIIIAAVIILLATIVIPNVLKARMSANDVMAQSTLKSVASALENYLAFNGEYPPDVTALTTAVPPYLNKDYFTGQHSGFIYAAGLGAVTYAVTAEPITVGRSGTTTYTITTGGVFAGN